MQYSNHWALMYAANYIPIISAANLRFNPEGLGYTPNRMV